MVEDFSYAQPAASACHAGPQPNLLIVADRFDVQELAPVTQAAGMRLLGISTLADAPARLEAQVRCDALLLFCPSPTAALADLLPRIEAQAARDGTHMILVAGWDTVDLAFASLRSRQTQLLCNPDPTELAAALLLAAQSPAPAGRVHEMDRDSLRLQQLSEDVGRMARTLEALTRQSAHLSRPRDPAPYMADRSSDYASIPTFAPIGGSHASIGAAPVNATQVRDLLRARRIRADFLPGDLFADPAWDMLLDLLAAQLEQERVSVSSLCIAAAVPPTTALRWIGTLTDKGLVVRQADPQDGRRVFIALAQEATDALIAWFGASRRYLAV